MVVEVLGNVLPHRAAKKHHLVCIEGIDMEVTNLNDIAAFASVVKAGSYTAAAKQLGLTRSAIGKSVVRLEQRLQVRLLNRTTRSLSLTDDGRVLYETCVTILEDL